jgi:phosphopantetheinyl transferase (holo-ACP synthase)
MEEFTVSIKRASNGQTVTITSQGTRIGRQFFNSTEQAEAWVERKTSEIRRLRRKFAQKEATSHVR